MSKSLIDRLFLELEPIRVTPTPLEAQLRGEVTALQQRVQILEERQQGKLAQIHNLRHKGVVSLELKRRLACMNAAESDLVKTYGGLTPVDPIRPEDFNVVGNNVTLRVRCAKPNGDLHDVELSYAVQPDGDKIEASMLVSRRAPDLNDDRIAAAAKVLENHEDLREFGRVIAMSNWKLEAGMAIRHVLWCDNRNGVMHDYRFMAMFMHGSAEIERYKLELAHSYDRTH